MVYGLDFILSKRYSIVEQTIFKLVLSGVYDMQKISALICIYSDSVLANAVKHLVNYQILEANVQNRTIELSASILAIIEVCNQQMLELMDLSSENNIYIYDESTKHKIMKSLFPEINMGFLVNSIDFVLLKRSDLDE